MSHVKKYILIPMLLLAGLLFCAGCTSSGGGTDIGEGYVGTLYYEDGSAASHVAVRITKCEAPSDKYLGKEVSQGKQHADELWLVTDKQGNIILENTVPYDGYYQMLSMEGLLKSFTDSIFFVDGGCDTLNDTLRGTGSLSGKVQLQFGYDPQTVMIKVYGAREEFYVEDTAGNFTIANLAKGDYKVRFLTTYDKYKQLDTVISIDAGVHDTIKEAIELPLQMVVQNFSFRLDTLMRAVTFYWDRIDTSLIGGYKLEIKKGFTATQEILLYDTSKTVYLKNFVEARVGAIDKNNASIIGNYTPYQSVYAFDSLYVKTIALPVDTTRAIGMAYNNGNLNVLRVNRNNPDSGISIGIYSTAGQWLDEYSLTGLAVEPLSITAYNDALYVLDRINNDTLCVKKVVVGDSTARCEVRCSLARNFGIENNLSFGPAGEIFIGNYPTIYVFDAEGKQMSRSEQLATKFAVLDNSLYTSSYYEPSKVIKYQLTSSGKLDSIDEYHYDKYNIITNTDKKYLAINNKGTICCFVDANLFIFSEEKSRYQRQWIETEGTIADMYLSDDNMLYMLSERCKLDVVNLDGKIISLP